MWGVYIFICVHGIVELLHDDKSIVTRISLGGEEKVMFHHEVVNNRLSFDREVAEQRYFTAGILQRLSRDVQ